ncbi:MAG TPA: SRPBCC family protein [Longimicrobiales bacterium]
MPEVVVRESAEIAAPPDVVYRILADYREGHPLILPPRWFTHLHVEQGGVGAGTVIRFGMKSGGRVREMRAEVVEPEPGRVLVERGLDERGTVTTFTVDASGAGGTRVKIQTTWRAAGIAGFVERLLAPALLKRVYREELARLAAQAGAL